MSKLQKVVVLNKVAIAENVFLLSFKRDFDFQAGQIIGLTNDPELQPRLYSICSAPKDEHVTILFNVKTDGTLTPPLAKVEPGDDLWISEVQGKFVSNGEPAWWIATGTGIAPFYSMFKSGIVPEKLIQGGRRVDDFYFSEAFSEIEDYVRCATVDIAEGLYPGRLTKYLEELESFPTDIYYYLCGASEMVVDVRNFLINKNVPFDHIITEIYF